uniref:Ig-like domain-containing protein n=1 Tax=Eptatretus burgeri TaxID=7764 RepID=A0A8C4Q4T4_EPTBU
MTGLVTFSAGKIKTEAHLVVREAAAKVIQGLEDATINEGSGVNLICTFSRLDGTAIWFHDEKQVNDSKRIKTIDKDGKAQLEITHLRSDDAGTYVCRMGEVQSSAILTVRPLEVTAKRGLECVEADEGGIAMFSCEVSHADIEAQWFLNGVQLFSSDNTKITQEGCKHTLTLGSLSSTDAGTITFKARPLVQTAELQVKESPVLICEALQDQEAKECENVTFNCRLSKKSARVSWQKGSKLLQEGSKYIMTQKGDRASLSIRDICIEDSGDYECDTGDDRTIATLTVKEVPVLIKEGLQEQKVEENFNATFSCHLSKMAKSIRWSKDGKILKAGKKYRMQVDGAVATLEIMDVDTGDAGTYECATRH